MGSLEGRTILVTRSADSNTSFAEQIAARGGLVLSLPTIEFADPKSWDEADTAIRDLEDYDGLLFTSRTAVERFLGRVRAVNSVPREFFATKRVYAIGEKTEEALRAHGFTNVISPEISTAEEMAETVAEDELEGKRFLFPKSEIARDVLPNVLRERHAIVDEVVVYRNIPPLQKDLDSVREALAAGSVSITTFFSPSAVRHFVQMLGIHILEQTAVAAIGPTTAKTAESFGISVAVVPDEATAGSLLDSIALFFEAKGIKQ